MTDVDIMPGLNDPRYLILCVEIRWNDLFYSVVICCLNNHYIPVCFHRRVNVQQHIVLRIPMIFKLVIFG